MKKIQILILVCLFVGVAWLANACEEKEAGMMKMEHRHGMMGKAMVPSNDGGVIVMMGNKLFKYDKNLNLVKEVEMGMGMLPTRDMKKECPMCKMMMKKEKTMGKESKTEFKDSDPKMDQSEHSSQH